MSTSIDSVQGLLFVLRHPRRILAVAAGLFGGLIYVWFAAVRAVPGVKQRKKEQRGAREAAWKR